MRHFTFRFSNGLQEVWERSMPSYADARQEALMSFAERIAKIKANSGSDWKSLTLNLTNESGLTLLQLEFGATEAAAVAGGPKR